MVAANISSILYLCPSYWNRLICFSSRTSLKGSIWKWKTYSCVQTLIIKIQDEELLYLIVRNWHAISKPYIHTLDHFFIKCSIFLLVSQILGQAETLDLGIKFYILLERMKEYIRIVEFQRKCQMVWWSTYMSFLFKICVLIRIFLTLFKG